MQEMLEKLKAVQKRVIEQIPFSANRFAEFEEYSPDATEEEIFQQDLRYDEHAIKFKEAEFEYFIFQAIEEQFLAYSSKATHNQAQINKSEVRAHLSLKVDSIIAKVESYFKILGKSVGLSAARNFINDNLDLILEDLSKGNKPKHSHPEYEMRLRSLYKLAEHRQRRLQHFKTMGQFMIRNLIQEGEGLLLAKAEFVARGKYVHDYKVDVGFCGELTDLALYYIFKDNHGFDYKTIELLVATYDEDNHVFIAIDRDPQSKFHDIANWGEKAIIFDPWHRLLCKATDYKSWPIRYFSYREDAKWQSITFSRHDHRLVKNIDSYEAYLKMTGNEDPAKRQEAIIKEYQLTSLQSDMFKETRKFLEGIISLCRPNTLEIEVDIFLTNEGYHFVRTIGGLERPIVAIHTKFLQYLSESAENPGGQLVFAVSNELEKMVRFGVGVFATISILNQSEVDDEVIKRFGIAEAAISYLRQQAAFSNASENRIEQISLPALINYYEKTSDQHDTRVKNIMTSLAKAKEMQLPFYLSIPVEVKQEVAQLAYRKLFVADLESKGTVAEKINHLASQLQEAKKELIPYELTQQPSVNIRHFTDALMELEIKEDDSETIKAIDDLVICAEEAKLPSLSYLYLKLNGKTELNYGDKLKPLGSLKKLQLAIDAFVAAKGEQEQITTAEAVMQIFKSLDMYFADSPNEEADRHLRKYQKEHDGEAPSEKDRYCKNTLGRHIDWRHFTVEKKEDLDKHLKWLVSTQNTTVAWVLLLLGYFNQPRVWSVLKQEDINKVLNRELEPISHSFDCNDDISIFSPLIVKHFSDRHLVDCSMLHGYSNFKEALMKYIEVNRFALISHGLELDGQKMNYNNVATRKLLETFLRVIEKGTEEDKQVIRRFFTEIMTDCCLMNIICPGGSIQRGEIYKDSLYYEFLIKQTYDYRPFKFFTPKESLHLILEGCLPIGLDWTVYLDLFDLDYKEFSYDCFVAIGNKLIQVGTSPLVGTLDNLVIQYLEKANITGLFTAEGIQLITQVHEWMPMKVKSFLPRLKWDLSTLDQATAPPIDKLVRVYKIIDASLMFPSPEEQAALGKIILNKLDLLPVKAEQVKTIETLLSYCTKDSFIPLTDYPLRNELLTRWLSLVEIEQDDGSSEYLRKVQKLIEPLIKSMSARDLKLLLSKFAVSVNSQQLLSLWIGGLVERDFAAIMKPDRDDRLIYLTTIVRAFQDDKEEQERLLEFLSTPLTKQSAASFVDFFAYNNKLDKIYKIMNKATETWQMSGEQKRAISEVIAVNAHNGFWDCTLEERAVFVDHLLIPPRAVLSDDEMLKHYQAGFEYVTQRILPEKNIKDSDDEFACSFLTTYLSVANRYKRGILLAGLLVAKNDIELGAKRSAGKIIVTLCEHLGPAYVKFGQLVHSHSSPKISAELREALSHLKSRANPPYRWHLWQLILNTLPEKERRLIKSVNQLLGSASFNIAVAVELNDGRQCVLSLLRENAREDSDEGFAHLKATIEACDHERLADAKGDAIDMLEQAKAMSYDEMDHTVSKRQYDIAKKVYGQVVRSGPYTINIKPAEILHYGRGFRLLSKVTGVEFNDLPSNTHEDRRIRRHIAKAILAVEMTNLFAYFDSDRHGNQLRIEVDAQRKIINIGLYDFGEMATQKPSYSDVKKLIHVITAATSISNMATAGSKSFDSILANSINRFRSEGQSATYLMRIRKGLLALQDFQKHVTAADMIHILKTAVSTPVFRQSFVEEMVGPLSLIDFLECALRTSESVQGCVAGFFGREKDDYALLVTKDVRCISAQKHDVEQLTRKI